MPAAADLARFLQKKGMSYLRMVLGNMPIEDRIDQVARVVLLALLLATLYSIV